MRTLKKQSGYITMVALWVSAILIVLLSGLTVYVKYQQRAVKNYAARVKAFYIAKAGANIMVYATNTSQGSRSLSRLAGISSLNKSNENVSFGEGVYTGTIVDEKSKANINTASEFLLRRMMEEIGIDDAAQKARGIMKWKREHGLFLHVEELGLVPELDVDDCFKITPYFTIYSLGAPGSCSVNVNTASLVVLKTQLEEFGAPPKLVADLMAKRPFTGEALWTFIKKRAPRMKDDMVKYFTFAAPVHSIRVTATMNETIKVTINTSVENWHTGHEVLYILDWWEE